jgi:glyoxylase-like metal-dependent hydrolase (beta-lactamase superfamily II)/rhodanese-related sulfurtransferase
MLNNNFITPEEVKNSLKKRPGSILLIDIRDESEYNDWNIGGSLNIPVNSFVASGDIGSIEKAFESIPHNKQIITVCKRGVNSQLVSSILRNMNYNSVHMLYGMQGWNRNFDIFEFPLNSKEESEKITVVQFVRVGKGCLSYIVFHNLSREAYVFDPSIFVLGYIDYINRHNLKAKLVIDTHSHADHFSGAMELAKALNVGYYINNIDIDNKFHYKVVKDIEQITSGFSKIKIYPTPGHTDGSLSFLINDQALICGDLLLLESIGRPDLARNQEETIHGAEIIYDTLHNFILKLKKTVFICPAHFTTTSIRPVMMQIGELINQNKLLTIQNKTEFIKKITQNIAITPPNYQSIKKYNKAGTIVPKDYAEDLEIGPNRCAAQ